MSGPLLKLPKWLWLLLALGIFGGQWHQLTCRMSGHGGTAALNSVDYQGADQPGSDDPVSDQHQSGGNSSGECAFHCQFSASIPCGLTPYALPVLAFSATVGHERTDPGPVSRLLAIEHPPQLA